MRWFLVATVVFASSRARADDVAIGAAVGAGGQGDAGYGALELRLDGEWHGVRIGLGGRAVMEGGGFRTREWSRLADAITIVRQLEAHAGPVAIAAGALTPATIGHVADGYRAALDDRARTGARIAIVTRGLDKRSRDPHSADDEREGARDGREGARDGREGGARERRDGSAREERDGVDIDLEASAEIDDVIDPALVGGAIAWQIIPAWGVRAATAIDPATERVAVELGGARRWERDDSRIELGVSIVGERWLGDQDNLVTDPMTAHLGLGTVGYASAAIDRAGARWTIAGDIRAGNGTNGAAFGPLYRVERNRVMRGSMPVAQSIPGESTSRATLDDAQFGIGAGLQGSMSTDAGWLSIGARWRPGLGALGTISAGAPMGRRVQAGGWIAASPRATAGAAEVRAVWATHFYTSLQMARMYIADEMAQLVPAWSATVWFGASTR